MRDLSGFVETRQQLLSLKPSHRMNWIGFAVAHHLNSKYAIIHPPTISNADLGPSYIIATWASAAFLGVKHNRESPVANMYTKHC